MTHLFSLAVCLLASLGQPPATAPAPAAAPPPPPAPPAIVNVAPVRLGVLSFNIRYGTADDKANAWEKRKDQVFEILKDDRLEVIGLQEALRAQLDEIHAACPKLGEIGCGREDGKAKGEYSAILYRSDKLKPTKTGDFWLSETPEVAGSKSWKTACARICTWARFENAKDTSDGKQRIFWVFNTHMDHVSADARLNGAKLIAKRIAERGDDLPFVLTGDFNSGESEEAARFFLAPPVGESPIGVLVDSFRLVHPYAEDINTYHGFDPTKLTGKKIDYILAPSGSESLAAWIDRRFKEGPPIVCPSDHFPIGAIVDLPAHVVAPAPVSAAKGKPNKALKPSGR